MAGLLGRYTIAHTESSLGWGGQEHRILAEANIMRARGHRLVVVCDPRGELHRRALREGFPVHPLVFGGMRNFKAWLALRRLLRRERVDILNTHSSLDSWVGFLAWRLMRRRPRLVRTRHLSTPISANWPTRWLYRAPAAVITTGQGIAELLQQQLGVRRERLHAIPTGVSLTEFSPRPPDPALAAGAGLPTGAFIVGAVSVLRSWKGHLYVLEALRSLLAEGWEVFGLVVGEGPYRPVLEAKVAEWGLAGQVRLVGHQERVPEWLALMDVFVQASYANEGIPQALLQALALEKPTVAAATGGIPEVVIPEETGLLVPPRDGPALAQAISRLLREPALGEGLGRQGRKLVAARHSLEQMADALEAVYGAIMAEGMSGPPSQFSPHSKGRL